MYLLTIFLRLSLAVVLGGVVGLERENKQRPAGFRTHILVCMGSALVMCTSEYMFDLYKGVTNLDPGRLGAQVISGIGFLGAGTIIREGMSVKGLTTAASLWAVACIGLAAGIGFYAGAVYGTGIIYFTLFLLTKLEDSLKKRLHISLLIRTDNNPSRLSEIWTIINNYNVVIRNMEFLSESEKHLEIRYKLELPKSFNSEVLIYKLNEVPGM